VYVVSNYYPKAIQNMIKKEKHKEKVKEFPKGAAQINR